ncbi:hypothetical protein DL93DRAFT_266190 [Clavulina sp. PMI_390]|nr:hypothetical protein DL93DRAFT_266190 [Clavulina sp. PMI_390]
MSETGMSSSSPGKVVNGGSSGVSSENSSGSSTENANLVLRFVRGSTAGDLRGSRFSSLKNSGSELGSEQRSSNISIEVSDS